MHRKATALLIAVLVAVSIPAAVTATAGAATEARADGTVTVRNAQVDTLELENGSVENVTVEVLRIDRLTVRNQTGVEDLNQTLGGENGTVVLRNVSFESLSLANASVQGLSTAGDGGNETGTDLAQVGPVSNATIERMEVQEVTIDQLNVSERSGGGVISGIADFIGGLFDGDQADGNETAGNATEPAAGANATATPTAGANETEAANETAAPGGAAANETEAAQETHLVVENVSVQDLAIEQMNVETLVTEEAAPTATAAGNETTADANETTASANETMTGANETAVGANGNVSTTVVSNVSVDSATIGSIAVERLSIETAAQEAGAQANATATPTAGANDTTPAGGDGSPVGTETVTEGA